MSYAIVVLMLKYFVAVIVTAVIVDIVLLLLSFCYSGPNMSQARMLVDVAKKLPTHEE